MSSILIGPQPPGGERSLRKEMGLQVVGVFDVHAREIGVGQSSLYLP